MTYTSPHDQIHDLLNFIDKSPSPWHVVRSITDLLGQRQFVRLDEAQPWQLAPGGRYFVVRDDSSIIVFVMGAKPLTESGFRLLGAHTDSPGLRIKPNQANVAEGLIRLNVEIYGSPILATFTDRDLSLAGRICYKNRENRLTSRLVNFETPLLRLPNLAIHMNRTVNEEGLKLHKQNELPLILSAITEPQLGGDYFLSLLAQQAEMQSEQILAWDLAVCDTQKGAVWGAQNEFYSNSRLDNLASCHAALQALLDENSLANDNTVVCALFDHEEIGSGSKQGADGSFLPDVLQRITLGSGLGQQDFFQACSKSFLISADMAHAYQPNFPQAYDPEHKVRINQGPVIKTNVNQRYSSESLSEGCFIDWCRRAAVPYQRYSHRCDLPCGSTIGPITSAKLGIRSIDIGNPMWAMHSIRESAGVYDHSYLIEVLKTYFKSETVAFD